MSNAMMSPTELREYIKKRTKEYLVWLRRKRALPLPNDEVLLVPKWPFMFEGKFRWLNFHPDVRAQVEDLLGGRVERKYDDAAAEIAIHDYIGHTASSQALCWNVVLPMKKHDNFAPLFEATSESVRESGVRMRFDFGVETAAVLEFNVAPDLGERDTATSIDLYLRTAQGKVCTIEFKLTEPDCGQCRQPREKKCDGTYGSANYMVKNDGYLCYLSKVGRKYWHLGAQYRLLDPTRVMEHPRRPSVPLSVEHILSSLAKPNSCKEARGRRP